MSGRNVPRSSQAPPDAIERTRKYRTAPAPLSLPGYVKKITPVKRPDHGTRGKLINLLVNWFRIKFGRARIFIYQVTIKEVQQQHKFRGKKGPPPKPAAAIAHSPTVTKIFWETVRGYKEIFVNLHGIVFDDYEFLYTPDRIAMERVAGGLYCLHPEKEGKKVKVYFSYVDSFDLDLSGDVDSNADYQRTSIYLKNLLSQNTRYSPPVDTSSREMDVSQRFTHIDGGMFFVPRTPAGPKVDILPGVQSWLGLYASVRRMENFDPVIHFGLVNKLFVELNLDLINFYLLIRNYPIKREHPELRNAAMAPEEAGRFSRKLESLKLKCDCVPGKDKDDIVTGRVERHFKFVSLKLDTSADREPLYVEDRNAREEPYQLEGRDGRTRTVRGRRWREVMMDEWYAAQGQPLSYPKLPLCIVKVGSKKYHIPMEVLYTHDQPQKYAKLLDPFTRRRIPELLKREPEKHFQNTNRLLTLKLEYDLDPFMSAVNIKLDRSMIECEGRVVEPCAVLGKGESDETTTKLEVRKDTGEFFLSRALETTSKKIRFVVYRLTRSVDDSQVSEFYQQLVKRCVARGFNVDERGYTKPWKEAEIPPGTRARDPDAIARLIEQHLAEFEEKTGKNVAGQPDDLCLVFLFFTKIADELYSEIKNICDLRYGIVSQVVDEETVRKACTKSEAEMPNDYLSIYHHICLKLNAKLGGVNQIVAESDEPEYGRLPSNERTMFIGIDVIHPSPNSPIRDCSLAAIVASLDKNTVKFAVRIKVNGRCNESLQQFDEHFSDLLRKYHAANGFFPDRVVIIRDGVSDSEMVKAASVELNSITVAWKKSTIGMTPAVKLPLFTYIVAQKRHKTRFYRRSEEGDVKNAPMGTIVDRGAVTPHMFDFYMVCHHTLVGTTRPIHYTVVYDDCDSSADVIQELLYRLCFLYARCSKPVSLPSPVYYAHLACERAAEHYQYYVDSGEMKEIHEKGTMESDLDYATRVELQAQAIEKKLQVSDKHPGMYFI